MAINKLAIILSFYCFTSFAQGRKVFPMLNSYVHPSNIIVNTALSDGDVGLSTTTLVTITDGKNATCSVWVKLTDGDGESMRIFGIDNDSDPGLRFGITRNASNQIVVEGRDSTPTVILLANTTETVTIATGWFHLYVCVNMANSSQRAIYINGVAASVTWTTYTNANLDMAPDVSATTELFIDRGGTQALIGALAEFWFDDIFFNDPSKFRNSNNRPISLGANGQLPTGSAPIVYLSLNGGGDDWATDSSGNGNTFTVIGMLNETTPP